MGFLDDLGLLARHVPDDARNALKGLLGDMPLTKALRGESEVSANGLKNALMGMQPFDAERGAEDAYDLGLLGLSVGHAKKGGQVGINNQQYKGGQFLPSSEFTEKGQMQFPKGMRQGKLVDIGPDGRAARPFDGAAPIAKQGEFDWPAFRAGGDLAPVEKYYLEYLKNPEEFERARSLADAYKRGARWTLDGKYFDVTGNELK